MNLSLMEVSVYTGHERQQVTVQTSTAPVQLGEYLNEVALFAQLMNI